MITSKNRWWIRGLFFGMFMFLFMSVLLPIAKEEELTVRGLIFPLLFTPLRILAKPGCSTEDSSICCLTVK